MLRNISRNKEKIAYPHKETDITAYLSVRYSQPRWIVKMWLSRFGAEKTEKILEGLLAERPVTVRVDENLNKKEKESLLKEISLAGIEFCPVNGLSYAYELKNPDRVENIPGFEDGRIMIQDAGSMEIVEMAQIQEGQYILQAGTGQIGYDHIRLFHVFCIKDRSVEGFSLNIFIAASFYIFLRFLENFPFAKERERTLFPGIDKTDGFYMISFLRKS
mgnify:CR=1 FL=1